MNLTEFSNQKVKISYPANWKYKVIFDAGVNAKEKVDQIMKDKKYDIKPSKNSRENKYESYDISMIVSDEHERLQIFGALKNIAKYVL